MRAICRLCKSEMAVEIVPCGKTAFLEAECPECKNAVDLIITAKLKRKLINSNETIRL